jgi:hypothetical protein
MYTTSSLRLLLSTMPTLFLVVVVLMYQSLKPLSSTFFAFCPFHFVSWTQRILTRHLIIVSTTSRSLPVSNSTFQVPTRNLLGSASFLTLIRRVKCEDPCSFFTIPKRRCSVSLRMRRFDSCSFNTVYRSRYGTPLRWWRLSPCPFNTIPRFWYGASLRGLRPNDFSCGFIFIRMAKLVVGSPRRTQPLLYPGLGPVMLEQHSHRPVSIFHGIVFRKIILKICKTPRVSFFYNKTPKFL